MKSLVLLLFLLPLCCLSQYTLTVEVSELKSSKGLIALGVYNSPETWLEDGETFTGVFVNVVQGENIITIQDLPAGTYAVSLYHDENGNKELDKNFFGVPKEPVGFSKGKLKTFGPPDFEECSFEVDKSTQIIVSVD